MIKIKKYLKLIFIIFFSLIILQQVAIKAKSINYEVDGANGDGRQNLEIAYNIYKHGIVGHGANDPSPSDWREPFNPFLVSIGFKIINLGDNDFNCIINQTNNKCKSAILPGKILNFVFYVLILLLAFLFLKKIKVNFFLIFLAVLFLASNSFYIFNSHNTESLTTLLFTLLFMSLYLILNNRLNTSKIVFCAVLFGLLIMTRFSYYYLNLSLIFLLIIFIGFKKLNLLNNNYNLNLLHSLKKKLIIFLVISLLFPLSWMVRNYFEVGVFHLSSRGINPLMYTAERLDITNEEMKYGIWHYFPKSEIRDRNIKKFNDKVSLRFYEGCKDEYHDSWHCIFHSYRGEVKKKVSILNYNNIYAHKKPALEIIKENLSKLPAISLISFIRGSLGLLNYNNNFLIKIFYCFMLIIFFIYFPLTLFQKNIQFFLLSLPVYFNFLLYSVTTLSAPRYTFPIIPYMTMLIIYLISFNLKKYKNEKKIS